MLITHLEGLASGTFDPALYATVMAHLEEWLQDSIATREDDFVLVSRKCEEYRQIHYFVKRLLATMYSSHPELMADIVSFSRRLEDHMARLDGPGPGTAYDPLCSRQHAHVT